MAAFVSVNNECGVIMLRLSASVLTTPDEPQSLKTLPRELFPKPPYEIRHWCIVSGSRIQVKIYAKH
jgi:hypothetical protein